LTGEGQGEGDFPCHREERESAPWRSLYWITSGKKNEIATDGLRRKIKK